MILGLLGGKPARPSSLGVLGARVCVSGVRVGTLRFFGTTELGPGSWCGIELDTPEGLNDGSVNGVRYFDCPPYHGLLAPESKVSYLTDQDSGPHSFLLEEDRTDSDSQISTPGSAPGHSSSAGSLVVRGLHDFSLNQSKHSSFELDESLGILTPDQMLDFAIERTPSCDDLSSLMLLDKKDTSESREVEEEVSVPPREETEGKPSNSEAGESKTASSSVCARSVRTPSVEDLPLDVEKKAPLPTSFVTSVTSITSLDNGYQGDGEWSRPASRGPETSPSAHQKAAKPRVDPMTDSDFFTESDADGHEDCGAHRKAQVIDGTLYNLPPAFPLPVTAPQQRFSPTNEEMESSGVYSDLDRQQPAAEDRPCSPEGSVRTVSSKSDQSLKKISPTTLTEQIYEQMATIKSLVAETEATPPAEEEAAPPQEPTRPATPAKPETKKYKTPKRNVVSKIKTMISGTKRDQENQENRVPGPTGTPRAVKKGRWDDVMNKIAQDKCKTSPRLKEVKSKVFEGLSLQTTPVSRKSASARTLGGAQSASTRSLRDIPNLKTKSRRSRLRGSETCLPAQSQGSSRNSSVSDVSQGTITKASTPSSARSSKKRETGRGSPQNGRKPSTPPPTNHKQPTGKSVQGVEKGAQPGTRKTVTRRGCAVQPGPQKPTPLRDQNRVSGGGGGEVKQERDEVRRLEGLGPPLGLDESQLIEESVAGPLVQAAPQHQQHQQPLRPELGKAVRHAATGVEALATLVNYLVHTLDAFSTPKLKGDLEKMKSDWIRAKLDLEEAQVSCSRLQELLSGQKAEHEQRLGQLVAEHTQELEEVVAKHTSHLDQVTTLYKDKLADVERTYKEEEAALRNKYAKEVEALKAEHEAEVRRLKGEARKAEEEARRLEGEVEASRGEVARVEALLEANRAEVARLEALLEASHRETEQTRQRLSFCVDKDTKGALSRIGQLESEVSSLRSVLELKSTEVQEQRRRSEVWRRDAEQLPALVTRVTTLQARLEDLQVRLQAKELNEQRLVQENRSLQETVSEENKAKKRLSLHNEELQWKLKQNNEVAQALMSLYSSECVSPGNMARLQKSPKSCSRPANHQIPPTNPPSTPSITRPNIEPELNGSRVSGSGDCDGGSPPSSPKVKAVVEKIDSVSWVLEMDDPPEHVASRLLRRAQSLRGSGNSPVLVGGSKRGLGKKWTEEEHVTEEVILVREAGGVLQLFGPEDEEIQIEAGGGDLEAREMVRRAEERGAGGRLQESGGEAAASPGTSSAPEDEDDLELELEPEDEEWDD